MTYLPPASWLRTANAMFRKYGRIPTSEEVEKGAKNSKVKGNQKWLLKLVSE